MFYLDMFWGRNAEAVASTIQLYSIRDTLRIIAYIVFLTIGGFLIEFVGIGYALYMSTLLAVISILIIYGSKDLAQYTVQ